MSGSMFFTGRLHKKGELGDTFYLRANLDGVQGKSQGGKMLGPTCNHFRLGVALAICDILLTLDFKTKGPFI
jgi:hypothetical protein